MTQPSPADTLRTAEERVRMGDPRIDIALRGPIAEWLDAAVEHVEMDFMCCDHGPAHCTDYAGPALAVARAILQEQP